MPRPSPTKYRSLLDDYFRNAAFDGAYNYAVNGTEMFAPCIETAAVCAVQVSLSEFPHFAMS